MTFRIQDYESIDIYPIIQDRFNWLVKLRRRRLVIQICAAHVKPLLLKTILSSIISECGGSRMEKSRMGLTMGNQKPMGNIFIVMD